MSSTFINGFGGQAVFGALTIPVESWSLNVNAEALDTTTTQDAGWETNITGAKSAEGSLKTYWDSAATQLQTLQAGSSGTATLTLGSSSKTWTFTCRLTQVTSENPVKGVIPLNISFKVTGAVTYPS